MDSLVHEVTQIVKLQRESALQRLSSLFSWPEFTDERRVFHQEFVYDVSVFAAGRGLSWPDVARTAVTARNIFPQLGGVDAHRLLSLLRDALQECLPNLTPVHRHEVTQFLTETCVTRRRLLQAVVGGAANVTATQLHLEVQLPPTPQPLTQGAEVHELERRLQQNKLSSTLQQKQDELRRLREGPRVTVEDIPEDVLMDKEVAVTLVRAAVKATEEQILLSLNREVSLLADILQLRLQQAALTTRRRHTSHVSSTASHPETAAVKAKTHTPKAKAGKHDKT
ncbi:hypothetical protein JOB18_011200 [Solea senegalensis]|uniref:Uncharacterized protein n=1 Tax=Solea senegalensis TaxID=28829 RepID=A0AAV6PPK1_SOLSE|nr:uncharacterized protein C8orf74 homolog [Solea senegalensis]XP_043872699.1 uncharacterized protein C8orf74 homolog [Solea senegalensis]KAG7470336.1 hypothetical protein JOB18_011200 [Solea senegalensis]